MRQIDAKEVENPRTHGWPRPFSGDTMTHIPGYDTWKTATPPYLEDGPEPQEFTACEVCDVNWREHWRDNPEACCRFTWHVYDERLTIETREMYSDVDCGHGGCCHE